ncbi:MAG: carbohydrate ABC transporter permease [Provencibacterium sp.]|nr:carbohydrate ABC transporter permease [Provencibacterium sp.]
MSKRAIRENRQDQVFGAVILLMATLILILVMYPLYFVVIASISDPDQVATGQVILFPKGISLEGYTYILGDKRIWTGYLNSILYAFFGTLIALAITIPAGYALSRSDLRGRGILMKLMVFTMYFSGGLIPTYLVVKALHLIDQRLVLMIMGSFSVYNLILTRTFFASTIPKELQEAADIDGCTIPVFFTHIVLPLSKSIIAIMALYYCVGHWNSFFSALVYINSQSKFPLQLILRDILISGQAVDMENTDPELLLRMEHIARTIKYGVIIVASAPVLCIYPFVQKHFVKGVMIGSIKG